MNIKSGDAKLVLLCPAWRKLGTAKTMKPATVIPCGISDKVIPFADSEESIKNRQLHMSALIEVGNENRLADQAPLDAMSAACL